MDASLVFRINVHPELDDRDKVMLVTALAHKEVEGDINQARLAQALHIGRATVERRFQRLRGKGLVSIHRSGAHSWSYDFSGFLTLHALKSDPSSLGEGLEGHRDNSGPSCMSDGPHTETAVKNSSETPSGPSSMGDPSLHEIKHSSIIEETSSLVSPGRKDTMVKVTGPDTEFKKDLEKIAGRPVKGERFGVPVNKQRAAMEKKEVSEYNCNDLWYIFKDAWRSRSWNGHPTRWTNRDRGHAKELIDEQGAENIVKYIKWVFAEWENLCRRYKVKGYPSIQIAYAYRRSWLPEALNKPLGGSPTVEFNEKTDIPSGSWGF